MTLKWKMTKRKSLQSKTKEEGVKNFCWKWQRKTEGEGGGESRHERAKDTVAMHWRFSRNHWKEKEKHCLDWKLHN